MEKKKGRGPDKNPGTRKKRSDAGKLRKPKSSLMWVPDVLRPTFEKLIKCLKNDKKNNKKPHRPF